MRNLPQVLVRVALGRQRIVLGIVDPAYHLQAVDLQLQALPLALTLRQRALRAQ
jgi:hypothetical protein